jgi:hypothetical protein
MSNTAARRKIIMSVSEADTVGPDAQAERFP